MEMNKYGMSAVALLGALLLGNGQAQASETLNTILRGGVGGVAGTMIGKQLGGDTGALVGAAVGGAAGGAAVTGSAALPVGGSIIYTLDQVGSDIQVLSQVNPAVGGVAASAAMK